MSIFDDPEFGLPMPEGVEEVPIIEEEPVPRISWPIVDRWCRENPGRVRYIRNLYLGITTYLRKKFPDLTVRSLNYRSVPGAEYAKRCDVLVCFVPQGEWNPLADDVPGITVRLRERDTAPRPDEG